MFYKHVSSFYTIISHLGLSSQSVPVISTVFFRLAIKIVRNRRIRILWTRKLGYVKKKTIDDWIILNVFTFNQLMHYTVGAQKYDNEQDVERPD